VYNIPDFDEPEPGRPFDACGTVIGASVVVVVEVLVVASTVVVVVSGAIVVAEGVYFVFGAMDVVTDGAEVD
jgi:hypothetical protein